MRLDWVWLSEVRPVSHPVLRFCSLACATVKAEGHPGARVVLYDEHAVM